MKKQDRISTPAVGGASLLVIFAVLCLCVFSMLCVSTVLAERRTAEASLESVTAYYAADLQAHRIFARLRSGEQVSGVETAEGIFSFSCKISENQRLQVQLQKNEDHWTVLRWQAVAEENVQEDNLPVWDGT